MCVILKACFYSNKCIPSFINFCTITLFIVITILAIGNYVIKKTSHSLNERMYVSFIGKLVDYYVKPLRVPKKFLYMARNLILAC